MAQRVWVRMELFEHFALQFPSRCMMNLTPLNVSQAVSALHALEPRDKDTVARLISFDTWSKVASKLLQWKEHECRAFWLVLVVLHRQIRVPSERNETLAVENLADEDYYVKETIPLFKLVIFLFLHLEKLLQQSKSKAKPALEAFNAVYLYLLRIKIDFILIPMPHITPNGASPASPHAIGLKDRSESELQYLNFIKNHLDTLIVLLFDIQPQGPDDTYEDVLLETEHVDLLGFLLAGGDSFLKQKYYFSSVYPKWQQSTQRASKISKWLKKYMTLNDTLYPPIGFALTPSMQFQLNGGFDLSPRGSYDMDDSEGCCYLQRNCLDSRFNIYTPRRSIFTGDNRGLQIGPYNCSYPLLEVHLNVSSFCYIPKTPGHWDKFICLIPDSVDEGHDAVVLESPSNFTDVCIPVKFDSSSKTSPFNLPGSFHAVVLKMQENVDNLRKLIASDDFDATSKRTLELAIQAKFKEWLTLSGNNRQVLDLVQLEKSKNNQ
ncbi:hypothetical protein THRCLA_02407 [Thraustotheca clavata]|uniref:Uncharacterized protein n=1 Tax=Thraustotheca clavata TaxID=74557 RepID=A0A1W0A5I2_9STRA|nr:hypothetical protein THRCLA_02407 [Thraustotheca clavata]